MSHEERAREYVDWIDMALDEVSNEISDFTKRGKFRDYPSNYQLLIMIPAPLSQFRDPIKLQEIMNCRLQSMYLA
jgi:hypothetical protein